MKLSYCIVSRYVVAYSSYFELCGKYQTDLVLQVTNSTESQLFVYMPCYHELITEQIACMDELPSALERIVFQCFKTVTILEIIYTLNHLRVLFLESFKFRNALFYIGKSHGALVSVMWR